MEALAAEREAQSEQHRATMEAMERTHRENMEALAAGREEHKDQHRENMEALKELIRRTAA